MCSHKTLSTKIGSGLNWSMSYLPSPDGGARVLDWSKPFWFYTRGGENDRLEKKLKEKKSTQVAFPL